MKLEKEYVLDKCEEAVLEGKSMDDLSKEMRITASALAGLRMRYKFSKWFEDKHDIAPFTLLRDKRAEKKKTITLKGAMTDPDFLQKVYNKIASKQLGEIR